MFLGSACEKIMIMRLVIPAFALVCSSILLAADPPATAPAPDSVPALIRQLADPDPAVREEASGKLKDIGKPALEALRSAAASRDPEISGRARGIIRRIERRPIPGPPPGQNPNQSSHSTRISVQDGRTVVDVDENGRKVHITKEASGKVEVSVTGHLDGKEVTETWKADSAEDLMRDDPEVHALLEKYGGSGAGFRLVGQGGQVQIQGNVNIQAGAAAPDPLMKLQMRIMPDLAKLPPAERVEVLRLFPQLRIARMQGKEEEAARLAGQLREKLIANGLDPGDDLPAPAKPATQPAK